MSELMLIKSTSIDGIFVLTYKNETYHEIKIDLAYEDTSPIITIEYPFSAYRLCSSSRWKISIHFDPKTMKQCAKQFLDAIDPEINTKELKEKLRSFKWQA